MSGRLCSVSVEDFTHGSVGGLEGILSSKAG